MLNRTKKVMPLLLVAVLLAVSAVPVMAAPPGPTIVDVAIAVNSEGPFAGSFDTLIAAVLAADPVVLATLTGNGQFTVFAPTDDAFLALGLDADNIGTLDQEALTQILLYHVARGRRYAEDVLESDRIRTLQGGFLLQDGGVLTDNLGREANIIVTDVPAANGIIHAIDAVVLPFAP
ncbi:MAG: fasciclin domain-containing protein [Anaerolineae bacterium]